MICVIFQIANFFKLQQFNDGQDKRENERPREEADSNNGPKLKQISLTQSRSDVGTGALTSLLLQLTDS